MFMTSGIVAVLVGLKFAVGFIIGAATAKLIYRTRLTRARFFRASLAAGIVFVLVSGVAGWAVLTPRSRMAADWMSLLGEKTFGLGMRSLGMKFYSALSRVSGSQPLQTLRQMIKDIEPVRWVYPCQPELS